MNHRLSVLATFLLLAILQVCAAFSTRDVRDGTYLLILEDSLVLSLRDQEPGSPVYLLDKPRDPTIWEVKNDVSSGTLTIQSLKTGLYLSYNWDNIDEPLKITTEKSPFSLSKVYQKYEILAGKLLLPSLAITKLPPTMPGSPPTVGLRRAHKSSEQTWRFVPYMRLDDSPRQYRYPFHRLRF
ncbi:hypothetical protein DFQ26_005971, partial [Actinomortierella ambigua]